MVLHRLCVGGVVSQSSGYPTIYNKYKSWGGMCVHEMCVFWHVLHTCCGGVEGGVMGGCAHRSKVVFWAIFTTY